MENSSHENKVENEIKNEAKTIVHSLKKSGAWMEKYNVWLILGILVLIGLVIFTVWIRTLNLNELKDVTTGEYTLGPDLDPYLFLRSAREISQGNLGEIDTLRMAPIGTKNFAYSSIMPWAIFYLYKLFNLQSIEFAAVIAPVIFSAIALIAFFLFVFELLRPVLGKKLAFLAGLISGAFYVVIPEMLHRTVAGIPELESLGMMFFWFAFFFFIWAHHQQKIIKAAVLSIISGLFTILMTYSWGGYRYIFLTFSVVAFALFFFNKEKKKNFTVFTSWLIPAIFADISNNGIIGAITDIADVGIGLIVFLILLVDFIIFNTKIRKYFEKYKVPESVISISISLGIILLLMIIGIFFHVNMFSTIGQKILSMSESPWGTGRITQSTAETRTPYFLDALNSFGSLLTIFIIGLILLFYEAIKHFKRDKLLLFLSFTAFILMFSFSKVSSTGLLNGTSVISKVFYYLSPVLFAAAVIYVYIRAYNEGETEDFKAIRLEYLFIISFSFWMILTMKSAIRLFFIVGPVFVLVSVILQIKTVEYGLKARDKLTKIILLIISIILVIVLIYTFVNYSEATKAYAEQTVPGSYYQQWQKAMGWVRDNTPENSIFVHWWDYGYWIQTLGKRATVSDGGHPNAYWDHMIGRYVLTAQSEKTALQFSKAHNVSYLLIDSTDIGKYPAYSSIGSNSSGTDRLSWINTFTIDEKQTRELKNETDYVYSGGTLLDQDLLWGGQLYPMMKAGIGAFILALDNESKISNVDAFLIYNNRQIIVPIRYVYVDGKFIDVAGDAEAINSTLYLIPSLTSDGRINNIGAAFYISEKAMKAEWVKLYLFNQQNSNFKLVHSEPALYVDMLNNYYNLSIGDFLFVGDILGPIKIWEVSYPEDIEYHEEYIASGNTETEDGDWAKLDYLGT